MPRRLVVLLTVALALGSPAAGARAAWFPAQPIDGPNADVVAAGQRRPGARRHRRRGVSAQRRRRPARRSSRACSAARGERRCGWTRRLGAATEAKVAVGDGNRLAVAWIADGNVYGDGRRRSARPPAPFAGRWRSADRRATSLDVDLGVNGAAYAVWQQSGDVPPPACRTPTWSRVAAPLDVDPALEAGTGSLRPRVAVSAEGYAVATWGDRSPGRLHARVGASHDRAWTSRCAPQDLTLAGDGPTRTRRTSTSRTTGRSPGSSSARTSAASRARSGGGWSARSSKPPELDRRRHRRPTSRSVDMSGAGARRSRRAGPRRRAGTRLLARPRPLPAGEPPGLGRQHRPGRARGRSRRPRRRRDRLALGSPDGDALARARFKPGRRGVRRRAHRSRGPTSARSRIRACSSAAIASATSRWRWSRATRARGRWPSRCFDRPPSAPYIGTSQAYKRRTRPELKWRPGLDLWGVQTYRVYVDSVVVGQTARLEPRAGDAAHTRPAHVAGRGRRPRGPDVAQPRAHAARGLARRRR